MLCSPKPASSTRARYRTLSSLKRAITKSPTLRSPICLTLPLRDTDCMLCIIARNSGWEFITWKLFNALFNVTDVSVLSSIFSLQFNVEQQNPRVTFSIKLQTIFYILLATFPSGGSLKNIYCKLWAWVSRTHCKKPECNHNNYYNFIIIIIIINNNNLIIID